jgi:hypothetical protein
MSYFKTDLLKEKILGKYLDKIYLKLGFNFKRIDDVKSQFKGIDVIITHKKSDYYIDEKSQLHYLNKDLPTFTFELSYLNKNHKIKEGWFFDQSKDTQYYFLITGIFLDNKKELLNLKDIKKLKITSVDRSKLIAFLENLNLNEKVLNNYDKNLRKALSFGKNNLEELNNKTQGLLFFTEHLEEKPMNLQLRLKFLIKNKIAKQIYPI